ncbi:MAG: PGF-pre-PGF domain-containing protein, partial [Nanoarchaeota archaeon]|nr:PGF-pre-PGF domain-containing protein [Nanoarchaeota archaeon]
FTIDTAVYSVSFTPEINYTSAQVIARINAVAGTAVAYNLSSSQNNITLKSPTNGNLSWVIIHNESYVNSLLGFTDAAWYKGTNLSFTGMNISDTSFYSTGYVVFNVSNWTDDIQLDYAWIQKTGDDAKYNITALTGVLTNSTILTYYFSEMDVGAVKMRMYCNDTYGNVNYTPEFNMTVYDLSAPVIEMIEPGNQVTVNNSYFNATFNVTEGLPRTAFCNWTLNATGNVNASFSRGSLSKTAYYTKVGNEYQYKVLVERANTTNYTFRVQCFDTANRSASDQVTFDVNDSTKPQITATTPTGTQTTTATTLSVTLSATTDERTSCKYGQINTAYALLPNSFTGTGKTHTATQTYTADDAAEIWYVRCTDGTNIMTTASTISYGVDVAAATTRRSSGGGGSPLFAKGDTVVASVTHVYSALGAGEKVDMKINNGAIAFTDVTFTVKDAIAGVNVKVEALSGKPGSTTRPNSAAVYKWLRIQHDNLENEQIEGSRIKFKVEKSWLTSLNVPADMISMFRWSEADQAWTEYEADIATEDDRFVYYYVDLPGLSVFMIGKSTRVEEEPVVEEEEVEVPEEEPPVVDDVDDDVVDDTPEFVEKKTNWVPIIIAFVVLVAVLLYIFMFRGKGKRGEATIVPPGEEEAAPPSGDARPPSGQMDEGKDGDGDDEGDDTEPEEPAPPEEPPEPEEPQPDEPEPEEPEPEPDAKPEKKAKASIMQEEWKLPELDTPRPTF